MKKFLVFMLVIDDLMLLSIDVQPLSLRTHLTVILTIKLNQTVHVVNNFNLYTYRQYNSIG